MTACASEDGTCQFGCYERNVGCQLAEMKIVCMGPTGPVGDELALGPIRNSPYPWQGNRAERRKRKKK